MTSAVRRLVEALFPLTVAEIRTEALDLASAACHDHTRAAVHVAVAAAGAEFRRGAEPVLMEAMRSGERIAAAEFARLVESERDRTPPGPTAWDVRAALARVAETAHMLSLAAPESPENLCEH